MAWRMEINSRIGREAQLLADIHQRTTAILSRLVQVLAVPSAPLATSVSPSGLRMVRIEEVSQRVGLSRSSLWRMATEGRFPKPRRLATHAVGWLDTELEDWLRGRAMIYADDHQQPRTRTRKR